MFDDVSFEFVLKGKSIIAMAGTVCAWLAKELVGNAVSCCYTFGLDVMNGLMDVVQCGMMANFVNSFDTLNKVLTGEPELAFHGE